MTMFLWITIAFVVLFSFSLMYAPQDQASPKKWQQIYGVSLLVIAVGLSIAWGIMLVAEDGWPESTALCVLYSILMTIVSAFFLMAGMVAVEFVWIIILTIFCPDYCEEFMDRNRKKNPKDKKNEV